MMSQQGDVDGAVFIRMLPSKIEQAKELVADIELTLMAAERNPDIETSELDSLRKTQRSRKFMLDEFQAMYDRMQKAIEPPAPAPSPAPDANAASLSPSDQ